MFYIIVAILLIVAFGCVIDHKVRSKKSSGRINPFNDRTPNGALLDLHRALTHLSNYKNIFTYSTTDRWSVRLPQSEIAIKHRNARVLWRYVELATNRHFETLEDGKMWVQTLTDREGAKLRQAMKVLIQTDIELSGGGFDSIEARLDSIIEMDQAGQDSIPNSTLKVKAKR